MGSRTSALSVRIGRQLVNAALEFLLPAVLVLWWWLASEHSTSQYFPPLSTILRRFKDVWLFSHFSSDALPTLEHLAVGYMVATALGVVIGVALGTAPLLAEAAAPVLEFVRATPVVALLPAGLLIFGIGPRFQIAVIAYSATWPILLNTVDGVRALDPVAQDVVRSYRLSKRLQLMKVVIPAAAPNIVAGMRTATSLSISVVIFSELMGATNGIGYQILQAQDSFAVPDVWAGMILLGILGYLVNVLFRG
ncbi:MAG: hypothetical protein QOG69_2753, partial [Actinomycetota bacterium]|nr:hypothetical protein [Actinomycetota bacterium]